MTDLIDRQLKALAEGMGKALAITKAELRKEHRAEIAALEKRVSDLERSRKGGKVVDMTGHIGRGRAA